MLKFCSTNFTSKENITKFYDFWDTHYIFPFFSHEQSSTENVVLHSQLRMMHVRRIAKSNSELIYFDTLYLLTRNQVVISCLFVKKGNQRRAVQTKVIRRRGVYGSWKMAARLSSSPFRRVQRWYFCRLMTRWVLWNYYSLNVLITVAINLSNVKCLAGIVCVILKYLITVYLLTFYLNFQDNVHS